MMSWEEAQVERRENNGMIKKKCGRMVRMKRGTKQFVRNGACVDSYSNGEEQRSGAIWMLRAEARWWARCTRAGVRVWLERRTGGSEGEY